MVVVIGQTSTDMQGKRHGLPMHCSRADVHFLGSGIALKPRRFRFEVVKV
jgi:hypothetical protein